MDLSRWWSDYIECKLALKGALSTMEHLERQLREHINVREDRKPASTKDIRTPAAEEARVGKGDGPERDPNSRRRTQRSGASQ